MTNPILSGNSWSVVAQGPSLLETACGTTRQCDAALYYAATEALPLLAHARRLAFAPPDGSDSWSSGVEVLTAATQRLAAPVPRWFCEGSPLAQAAPQQRGESSPASRMTEHVLLTQAAATLARSARELRHDAGSAIRLGDRIIDLQLRVALHRNRLGAALGSPSEVSSVPDVASEQSAVRRGWQ